MMSEKKRFLGILSSFAIIYGLIFLVLSFMKGDETIRVFFLDNQNEIVRNVMVIISFLGTASFSVILFLAVIILAVVRKYSLLKASLLYAAGIVGTALITYLMKITIQKERPFNVIETGFSFPSGHSSASMAAYGALAFLLWPKNKSMSLFVLLIPIVIGFSRIYLGVHWASDVAAGLFLGAVIMFFLITMIYKEKPRKKRK